jgi:small-conductance mechanosensitive channel
MEELIQWIEQNLGISRIVQGRLLDSLVLVLFLWLIYKLVSRALIRRISDPRARYQWLKVVGYFTFAIGALAVAQIWFNGIQSLATYLGLLTAALTVALRDPITDIIGWLFILSNKTLEVGQRVQIGEHTGDVIDRGVFQISLMEIGNWVDAEQSTGRVLHIPNGRVFTTVVANYSRGMERIWNEIPVLLSFDSNWEKAKGLLEKIVDEHGRTESEAAEAQLQNGSRGYMIQYNKLTPIVYTSVRENGILLTIRYLCDPRQRRDSTQAIWEAILREFERQADIRFQNAPQPAAEAVPAGDGSLPEE